MEEPHGIFFHDGNLYVADCGNNRILRCEVSKSRSKGLACIQAFVEAGSGVRGFHNSHRDCARFYGPHDVVRTDSGDLFVADMYNHAVRKVANDGIVSVFGALPEEIHFPHGVAFDEKNRCLFVSEYDKSRILQFDVGTKILGSMGEDSKDKIVVTMGGGEDNGRGAAGPKLGFDDGDERHGKLNHPAGMAIDRYGDLIVADTYNHAIRRIRLRTDVMAAMTTIAGIGKAGNEDGPGMATACFNLPTAVAIDQARGFIYVADFGNHKIRKIDGGGNVTTVAGSTKGKTDGNGLEAKFNHPSGIAVGTAGKFLYVADTYSNSIREINLGQSPEQHIVTTLPIEIMNDISV